MPEYSAIVRTLTPEKFSEILSASARKARETYFHRHNIRSPSSTGMPKAGAKNAVRAEKLFAALQTAQDERLCEEMLRTWLLTKRPMLAAALDYLEVPHDNGLTDSDDVAKIEKLSKREVSTLLAKLESVAGKEDAAIYLKFMGVTI